MKPIRVLVPLMRGYLAMAIFPFIFINRDLSHMYNNATDNHERIHLDQQLELFLVGFYLIYLIEFLIRLIQYRDWHSAYRNISFEREAYSNQYDLLYTVNRDPFSWIDYINIK